MRLKLKNDAGIFEFDANRREENLEIKREDVKKQFNVVDRPPAGYNLNIDGQVVRAFAVRQKDRVFVHFSGKSWTFKDITQEENTGSGAAGGLEERQIVAPMPGTVIKVMVKEGDVVSPNQPLVIVEAMKMENEVRSPAEAIVGKILVQAGQQVGFGETMIELIPPESEDEN